MRTELSLPLPPFFNVNPFLMTSKCTPLLMTSKCTPLLITSKCTSHLHVGGITLLTGRGCLFSLNWSSSPPSRLEIKLRGRQEENLQQEKTQSMRQFTAVAEEIMDVLKPLGSSEGILSEMSLLIVIFDSLDVVTVTTGCKNSRLLLLLIIVDSVDVAAVTKLSWLSHLLL